MSAPKRQRLSGSFSPASPPYHLAKGISQTKPVALQQPNTPISPPLQPMSSLPASTSTGSNENTQLSEITQPSTMATPANIAKDEDGDAEMTDGVELSSSKQVEENVSKPEDSARTDHDRIQDALKVAEDTNRLREYLSHVDVGPLYKIRDQSCPLSSPRPSDNLITMYNLSGIAKTVERFDPVTGVKTNKLRKSYENQIKQLGLAGRNKARESTGSWIKLMAWPEDEYRNTHLNGKAMENAHGDQFKAKLARALSIPVPQQRLSSEENERWKALIGIEEPTKVVKPMSPAVSHAPQPMAAPNGIVKPVVAGAVRPDRSGKKRRYNDASFPGYGGYLDDEHDDSEDGMAMAARRKRPKA